jgi:hypothetical protein
MTDPVHLRNITIDTVHQKTHEGRYFSGGAYLSNLANGATLSLLIQSDPTQSTHTRLSVTAGGNVTLQLYEGVTISVAGSAVTMSNHNRSSSKVFAGTVTSQPTTSGGSQLNATQFIAGGSGPHAGGGGGGFSAEWVLAPSQTYLAVVTNTSGGAIPLTLECAAYQPDL